MIPANLEKTIEEGKELTEQQLNALYVYLDMYMDAMSDDEKMFWSQLMMKLDKEFYDDTSDGPDDMQNVQGVAGSA